jgi:glycosyltransferase involved in cell wall biosynthesis
VMLQYHCAISTAGLAGRVARGLAAGPHLVAGLLASQILVVSPHYARQSRFCRLFWRKLVFVTPPVPIKLLQPLNRHRPARAATAALRIGYVGRIARQKSLPLLLQAFAGLGAHLGRRVDLDLIGPAEAVVGEDDWRAILQHAAEAGSPVQYLGVQGPDALRESYAGFDLLVLPSTDRQESFGLVQVEAMVQGTPVVAFDLPGVCEPIQQTGMGLLARAGSVSDLRRAMIEVLQNGPAAQPGPAALLQQFGPEITCAAYLAALRPRSR